MPKPIPQPVAPFVNPDVEEERNVHEVYEAIAPHFSQTRFKPWPLISAFLSSLPKNALGLDTGGGNGKYLPVAHSHGLEMIETDRSSGLLKCARGMGWGSSPDSTPVNGTDGQKQDTGSDGEDKEGGQKKENLAECVRGDLCGNIWRPGTFDFAISIAAIHHLSTDERRRHAVKTIMKPLKLNKKGPYSRFMIYVWAYEQGEASKRKMGSAAGPSLPLDSASNSEPTEAVEGAKERVQDVLVPWVLAPKKGETGKKVKQPRVRAGREGKQGKKGALAGQEVATSQLPSESTTSPSETTDKPSQTSTIPETPTAPEPQPQPLPADEPAPQVFHRYYHLFVQGELQALVESAAREEGYKIVPSVPYSTTEGMEAAQVGLEGLAIDGDAGEGEEREEGKKWMKVRGVGWEMDNWWLEGDVGVW
ncbi:hypothetical protein L198_08040 [Cryptococcus wingfieldii CBS 7118]|uniref:Methyltransferase type 11 domain-containing protein n=1 Tax=Cryptococcus wingfieldii CBS 7118 TaxID=1295528 RepID=A0A1E3HMC5_9TREE|nr:hypothetical protein L198_08040 [Cryptococcus wingfieldii CBS 7118]ODN77305.1 hypothetical protein L198_08040 [Cryptococcus wingfieldii CBS 7118]